MTAYRETNDYDFKATEINYTSRERGIGSGYMLIPVEYNDFTDGASLNYYALQEDEIYIKNIFGDVVFRGYITNASALTSAIRLDFNDLSGLTRDKSCKRDYRLYKGSVAVAETNTIKDASASWSTNQWNGYGVVCQPGIIPRSVLKAACSTNTGTIGKRTTYTKISGTNLQRKAEHHGFGWGQPDNLTGTYSVPNIPTVAGQGDIYRSDYQRTCSPSNLDKAKALLSEEAVTASTDECVRWYYGTTSGWGGNCYPIADMYINLGEIPVTDVQGFRIKIQGAVRHTNQEANGIHIYIMQYADADNGSGTWEDLSASPAGPIVTLDANNDGVWGVFDYKFELSTGVQGEYINLDEDSWNNYIYEYREYNNNTDTKARHKVMRIMIRGYDDCNGQNGYGMNIGSVQVWLHRVGTDTNQYKITATTAPVTLTVTPDPASTVGMGDILRIAPSLETLYNDISDSEYGYDGYPFVLDVKSGIATEMQNKFLSVNHLGSFHYDIIETIADFGKYNWWFDPYTGTNGYLYIGGDADRGSSGFTFDNTNIPPDGGHLMYPIDNIIGTVFARGNSSLGIVYEKTGSADSSKEVVLKLQGVSSFAELRTFADNLWDKWHLRKPVFSVNLDYNALGSNVRLIKPGMTVTVTYKNLSSEVLPVRRIEVSWEEGKRPQLFVEASEIGTPEEEKIGDKLAKMRARLNRGLNDYIPSDEESTLEIRLKEGKFQKNDDTAVITADGSTPLEDDWFTGDINLTSVMTSFFDQVYENGAISHDGVNDFAMNITSWLFGDLLGLNNPSGSNPTMTAEDSAVVTQLNIPNDVYIDGATSDFQCNYINVNDGSSGITLKDGTNDVVLSKVYNYAELDCIADFKSSSLILDNPSGSDPELYPEDSVANIKIIIPNDCYIDGAGTSDFQSNNVILSNPDAGDDQYLWSSGTTGYETVEVTNDFKCISGKFAAVTILLGTTTISEPTTGKVNFDGDLEADGDVIVGATQALTYDPILGSIGNADGGFHSPFGHYRMGPYNFRHVGDADGGCGKGFTYIDEQGYEAYIFRIEYPNDVIISNTATNGTVRITANANGEGDTYEVDVATFTDTEGTFHLNLLMDGTGTDNQRIRAPYLTAIPSSADNGSLWMESDGLHVYYGGAEATLSGGTIDHGSLGGLGDDDHSAYRYWLDGYIFSASTTGSTQFTNQTGITQTITYHNPSAMAVGKKTSNYSFQARFTTSASPRTVSFYHSDDDGVSWTLCEANWMVQNTWDTFTCTHKFTSEERADDLRFKMEWGGSVAQEYQSFTHATLYTGYKVETGTE